MTMPHSSTPPGFAGAPSGPARKVKSKSTSRAYMIGALAACALAFLVVFVGSRGPSGKWVLVARQSIAARSSLDVDLFEARQMPEDAIVAGAISSDSEAGLKKAAEKAGIDGSVAQYPLPKGGQFSTSLISTETDLARPLTADERLISVPAAFAASLAGTLKVGDHVDLYGIGTDPAVINLLLGDVEIVAVALPEDQVSALYQSQLSAADEGKELSLTDVAPGDPIPGVFTLRVPVSEVGTIAIAAKDADLVLTYRGADASATPHIPTDLITALCSPSGPEDPNDQAAIDAIMAGLPAACNRP